MKTKDLIKQRREELHLTVEQVGQYVGVGKGTVSKWENGKIDDLKRDKIAKLAKILEISPLDLIYDDVEYENNSERFDIHMRNIINISKSLNDNGMIALEKYAKYLLTQEEYLMHEEKGNSNAV